MMGFMIAIHLIVCSLLIGIILIQRGRGGGLAESFSGVESMFGTKTSSFLSRTTTVLSVLFFITCLSLAFLSARQSRSLMRDLKVPAKEEKVPAPLAEPKVLPEEETKSPVSAAPVPQEATPAQQDLTVAPQATPTPAAEAPLSTAPSTQVPAASVSEETTKTE